LIRVKLFDDGLIEFVNRSRIREQAIGFDSVLFRIVVAGISLFIKLFIVSAVHYMSPLAYPEVATPRMSRDQP
jgi:hypothetical protein